jgi:glycosyltransferase involved in cell wall biosynthesis
MKKKVKILELCHFSAGGCGVWARVKQESQELVKRGYDVRIFSSFYEKGTNKIMPLNDKLKTQLCTVPITRFPAKILGGESFMKWDFEKEALEYSPDIIMAHNYRQLYTTKALKIVEKLRSQGKKVKIFLVTHAPFVEGDITRSFAAKWIVRFYDKFIGPKTLSKFDKIITISHWEIPYLLKAGAKKEKLVYIPNGIPDEFFQIKNKTKPENKILFLGRIAPKKKIETLIESIRDIADKNVLVEIVGPPEERYLAFIRSLISEVNVEKRVIFSKPIYDLNEKIKKLDSAKIFVLPSRVEGMPQSLIEAMARGKIVIGSDSIAIRDLIQDNNNGFLFEFNNPQSLAEKINLALKEKDNSQIAKNAKKFASQFAWNNVIKKIIDLF